MALSGDAKTTFHYDRLRAVSAGIIETAGSTFLLLIAVKWFHAGAPAKATIAAAGSVGLLISPAVLAFVTARQWKASKAASGLFCLGSVSFIVSAVWNVLPVFVVCAVVGMACSSAVLPLLTQIYQDNYPIRQRGSLFSKAFIIRIATAAVFSYGVGRLLSENMNRFPGVLLAFAAAFAAAAWCLARVPSRPIDHDGGTHPFRSLRFVRDDALFRRTLTSWMILGFANLMMLPLRVEYLANPVYNLGLTVLWIALLTEVIPNVARLCLSPVWGWLFDKMNFFMLRAILNLGFGVGILAFFVGDGMTGLIIGAVVYGVSRAGGDVAWSLWVTKVAPAGRVAEYMAVHTFFTGVRGVCAPALAFLVVQHLALSTMGWISAGLILTATLMLVPEIRLGRKRRDGQPLVEEFSE